MDKKKILIFAFFFILYLTRMISGNGTMKVLSDYLKSNGVNVKNIEYSGYSNIKSNQSPEEIALNIYKASGLREPYKLTKEKGFVLLSSNNAIIKTKRLISENLNYASFILSQHMDVKNINNIRNCIFKAFSIYDVKPVYSFLIKGVYSEKMTLNEMKIRASQILLSCRSEYALGMDDGSVVSYIGLIPLIHEKVKVMNGYTNINVALRANKPSNNTYIWIGCPIITAEY